MLVLEGTEARREDQREELAAVLMALAVLPASHLRAGATMSLTTNTRQELKEPRQSRVSGRLRRSRESMRKDCSLVVGSGPVQRLVRMATTVRGKCPVRLP